MTSSTQGPSRFKPIVNTEIFLLPEYYATTESTLGIQGRTNIRIANDASASYNFETEIPHVVTGDRIVLSPDTEGSFNLKVSVTPSGSSEESITNTTVRVITPKIRPAYDILLVGDSLTSHQTYPTQVQARIGPFGGHLVGTVGQAQAPHEGHSGWQWETFKSNEPLAVSGSIDIPNYLGTLGRVPRVVVWLLGTNGIFPASEASYPAKEASELAIAQEFVDAWVDTIHVIALTLPGNEDDAIFASTYPSHPWELWRSKNYSLIQKLYTQFKNQRNVYVIPTHTSVDPTTDYGSNAVHPVNGYDKLGDSVANFILWASNQGLLHP